MNGFPWELLSLLIPDAEFFSPGGIKNVVLFDQVKNAKFKKNIRKELLIPYQ